MTKTKNDLIKEANQIAEDFNFKKSVINKMLDDLDQKDELSEEHINGMAIIQDMLKELDELKEKHNKLREQIKG